MAEFVALYRGRTVMDADLVAVTAEPQIVRRFFSEMLGEDGPETGRKVDDTGETRPLSVVSDDEG